MIADPGCRSRSGACSGTNGMPTLKVKGNLFVFAAVALILVVLWQKSKTPGPSKPGTQANVLGRG